MRCQAPWWSLAWLQKAIRMPARIMIVHDGPGMASGEPGFAEQAAAMLKQAGYDAAPFADPIDALDALDTRTRDTELLVTCANFAPGKPNGEFGAQYARARARVCA